MVSKVISEKGQEQLKKELEELKTVTRPEIIRRVEVAKELGDLSENAEYHDAKDQMALVDARINELEDLLGEAVVMQKTTGSVVGLGSSVDVRSEGVAKNFKIVGASEANPVTGHISLESPIGKALMGREAGEEVVVETPVGTTKFIIEKVE
ncbi:MAG: transcription elongation factor GreA [bacterium]